MDNDLVLTSVASFIPNFEIFYIYRQLNTVSRSLWRNLVAERSLPNEDLFELLRSAPPRSVWLDRLLSYALTSRVFEPSINGDTIVHRMARRGDLVSVYILMHLGIAEFDPNSRGGSGMTVLHCAAAHSGGAFKLCKLLLRVCDPTIRDDIGRLAEDWANKQHVFEVAELLRNWRRLPPPSVGCFPFQFN